MAFTIQGGGRSRIARSTLAEINVTPLVDVMLVLLVIFMVASAVETARLSREAETLRQVVSGAMEQKRTKGEEHKVAVDLPKAHAAKIGRGNKGEAKPVLTIDDRKRIWLDREQLIDCGQGEAAAKGIDACLDRFEAKLQTHPRAQELRELHLRADRKLDYGLVLSIMARLRRIGIAHFGLVSEAPPSQAGDGDKGGTTSK